MRATKKPGAFCVSLTPFDSKDRLDEGALRAHMRRMADAGIGVYLAGGGSGEGYTLARKEFQRVLEIGVEELKGKVPVRAMGLEPRSAKELVEFVRLVEPMGFDAIQIFSLDAGHAYRPADHEIELYFRDVLEHVKMPAVLSTHFSVGYMVPLDVIKRLVDDYDQVIGVDCTAHEIQYLARLIALVGSKVDVYVGGPMQGLECLALGGRGFVISEPNLAPRMCNAIIKAFQAGNTKRTFEAYGKLLKMYTTLSPYGSIRGIKAALDMLGLPGGTTRRPRTAIDAAGRRAVAAMLDELDIRKEEGLGARGR